MITLIRLFMLKSKEIKYKLAFYSLLDNYINVFIENQEEIKNKFIYEFAKIIHDGNNK